MYISIYMWLLGGQMVVNVKHINSNVTNVLHNLKFKSPNRSRILEFKQNIKKLQWAKGMIKSHLALACIWRARLGFKKFMENFFNMSMFSLSNLRSKKPLLIKLISLKRDINVSTKLAPWETIKFHITYKISIVGSAIWSQLHKKFCIVKRKKTTIVPVWLLWYLKHGI